jgi:putative transcriptional regulator
MMNDKRRKRKISTPDYLKGQLLIAMPTMSDKRFRRSVIYMCSHSSDQAMGLIINQRDEELRFPELLTQLKILDEDATEEMPPHLQHMGIHVGGPVSKERGFVLHSDDYFVEDSTLRIANGICLTATIDILRAMANGKGPERALLALGYSGWAPGQLETEIQANGWLHCKADADLVFGPDLDLKYDQALSKIGVDPSHFVSEAGHA